MSDGFNDNPCAPPAWFGVTCEGDRVTGLQFFANGLSGQFPRSVTELTQLQVLSIGGRGVLTGQVYPELAQLDLRVLELFRLNFEGVIPPEIGSMQNLESLVLFGLGLEGSIPPELGQLENLVELGLEVNSLTGEIPPELGNLANLTSLTLFSNHLSGRIPRELGQLTRLQQLDLQFNDLTGPIPPELGALDDLRILRVNFNRLSGSLPNGLSGLQNLDILDLSFNRLGGSIPAALGGLVNITQLSLNANLVTGEIPEELAQLQKLVRLNLRGNQLEGDIPAGLGNSPGLTFLGLSGNRLSGELPANLNALAPSILDVRENRLDFPDPEQPQGQGPGRDRSNYQNLVALYPQLAIGGDFQVVLQLTNRSINPWHGRIVLDGGDWPVDRPWEVDQIDQTGKSSIAIDLPREATRRLVLTSSSPEAFAGFLAIQSLGNSIPEDVAPAFYYNLSANGELADSTGVAPAALGIAFHFPVERRTRIFTGVAFRSVRRPLSLRLKDANGFTMATANREVDGALLLQDLFPSLPGNFQGALEVTSGLPFYVTVLRGEVKSDGSVQLTSIPASNLLATGYQMIFPFQ